MSATTLPRVTITTQRKALKLSQGSLGKLVGLTAGDVSRIELGYRDPSPREAAALAEALGLPPGTQFEPLRVSLGTAAAVPASRNGSPALERVDTGMRPPAPPPPARQEHPKPETADLPSLQPLAPPISEFSGSPDLSEPARFSELPDFRVLEARDPGADTRLAQALRYATKILHTSRVPAAVWREWRQFEKALLSRLKERVDEVVVVTGEN